jgi:hypothetical protein
VSARASSAWLCESSFADPSATSPRLRCRGEVRKRKKSAQGEAGLGVRKVRFPNPHPPGSRVPRAGAPPPASAHPPPAATGPLVTSHLVTLAPPDLNQACVAAQCNPLSRCPTKTYVSGCVAAGPATAVTLLGTMPVSGPCLPQPGRALCWLWHGGIGSGNNGRPDGSGRRK